MAPSLAIGKFRLGISKIIGGMTHVDSRSFNTETLASIFFGERKFLCSDLEAGGM